MSGTTRKPAVLRSSALGIAASWFLLGAGVIEAGETILYELLPGSRIVDACTECDGPPIERDLTGYLQLEPIDSLPGATTYRINNLFFSSHHFEYVVLGEGAYRRLVTWPPAHEMELTVSINRVGPMVLNNDPVEITESWPIIEIEVREPAIRDPQHFYTVPRNLYKSFAVKDLPFASCFSDP